MNELTITVVGWAATDVRLFVGQGSLAIASFRVASTPRFFDRERSVWVDGTTEWFTVRVFRGAAYTVNQSIQKGQPVVVTGRMRTNTWEAQDGPRTEHVIEATAVGPDCTRGVAAFTRATGDGSITPETASAAAEAIAADQAARGGTPEAPVAGAARASGTAMADASVAEAVEEAMSLEVDPDDEPPAASYEEELDLDDAPVK